MRLALFFWSISKDKFLSLTLTNFLFWRGFRKKMNLMILSGHEYQPKVKLGNFY